MLLSATGVPFPGDSHVYMLLLCCDWVECRADAVLTMPATSLLRCLTNMYLNYVGM